VFRFGFAHDFFLSVRQGYTHISALAKEQAVGNLNSQPSQPVQ
jgi:hypothetical protein